MTPDLCLLSRPFVPEQWRTVSLGAVDWAATGTFKGALLKKGAEWLNQTGISKSVLRGRCSFIEAEHKENGWYLLKYIEVTNEIGMYLTDHIIPLLSGPVWLLLVGGNDQFSLEVQACVVYEVFIAWKRKMVRLNISQRLTCTNV